MAKLRVVIDTNVLVSALIKPDGRVAPVLHALRDHRYRILYNRAILDELVDVLARPWLSDEYGVTEVDVEALLRLLLLRGEEVEVERVFSASRDPHDDKFLAAAAAGDADAVVSGDRDLLDLDRPEGIPVLTPAEFLARLE